MNKFLRRNNKKLLAIFGVFLMIAFVVQTRFNPSSGGRGTEVIGHIGNDPVIGSELESSRQEWHLLTQAMVFEYPEQSGRYHSFLTYQFPPAQAIDQDPKLYFLLQKEADRDGASVTDEEISEFLARQQINIQMPTGSVTHFEQIQSVDPDYAAEVRQAIGDFIRVEKTSGRALDLCKFSRPLKEFALAEDHQNISVRLVNFDAKTFTSKVPAPTTQQLSQQFEQFADLQPSGMGSDKNPLGIGYQVPDQVRLQTIAVPRQLLKDAVRKSKSDYDWEVQERSYYIKHKAEFAATQPVSPPPTAMVTLPSTQASATTKPFVSVQAEILDKVMAPDVDELSDKVQKSILTTLSADWAGYHAAHPDTQPTTAPSVAVTSSLGVPYESYDYMKALAAKVQKDFNVLPETAAYNKPLSAADLAKLPGIGHAHTTAGSTSFDAAAMDSSLAVLQPSAPLQDDNTTFYQFRLSERIAAHRPASMEPIADAVKADWVKAQAYLLALARANEVHDAAAKTGLASAGAAAGQLVVTTGPFSAGMVKATDPVPSVPLAGDDVKLFKQKCQSVLEAAAKHEPPVAVVEAPNESKVLVIELADVQPDWARGERYVAEARVTRELLSELAQPLQAEWFTLQGVEARLGYVDVQKEKSAG